MIASESDAIDMTVTRARYVQAAALILILGLPFMAWVHLPRLLDARVSDATTGKTMVSVRKESSRSCSTCLAVFQFLFLFLVHHGIVCRSHCLLLLCFVPYLLLSVYIFCPPFVYDEKTI